MADEQARLTMAGKLISILLMLGLIGTGIYVVSRTGNRRRRVISPEVQARKRLKPKRPIRRASPPSANTSTCPATGFRPSRASASTSGTPIRRSFASPTTSGQDGFRSSLPIMARNRTRTAFSPKKYGFQVEMVLMDDPVVARDAFAAGEVHTLWGTVDMMTLFAPELTRDSRTSPRVVQQIDWSNGGDGIVVRNTIKSVSDLKGKTITLAQNSPSEYYLTSLLLSAGMSPSDVKVKYTATAFEAAAAFVADKNVDACVSWAPDIYKIPERVGGTRILSSTADANKLIADVYAFRADFARDHPEIVEGLVAGIFEGMDMVKEKPEEPAKWMADAFGMKPEDVMGMRNDSHPTNLAENVQFFLNASNPTNFERTWKNAAYVYRELGRINAPVQFDQVMDFSCHPEHSEEGNVRASDR